MGIQEIRERAGLSRYALAKKAGMTNQTLYMIEKKGRHPTLDTLRRLSAALAEELGENPADLLLTLVGPMPAQEAQPA